MAQQARIISIVFLAMLCISACKCGQKRPPPPVPVQAQAQNPASIVQALPLEERVTIQYPEVFWLAQAEATEESHATTENSFSQKREFHRALLSLHSLRLILDGSDKAYQEWTAAQLESDKLSRASFNSLHEQGRSLLASNYQGLSSAQIQQAMETMIVLGEIGKSEKGKTLFKHHAVMATDPEEFYEQAITVLKNNPRLSRSFSRLPYTAKQLLQKTANLVHCQQLLQLEATPSLFTKLKASNLAATDPIALSFAFFVETCKFAGTLGHVNNLSSLVYTEQAHQTMQRVAKACYLLADPMITEFDAYNSLK
ncbi:MAG TPA: hypothetical protein VHK67_07725 [Rhabdochlamydiaceae bacterium]|jgi:hypothetical protein|nr:hypothetical protein [Rhabdochlamydiaceae bacterium]